MKKTFNHIAIVIFSFIARVKGYRFCVVSNEVQNLDADTILQNEGYKLPDHFENEMGAYKKHTVKFIAYHRNVPVGVVGLANPKIANRPFDLHGIDENGEHFEIQSLIVSKKHRDCSQLVLLGLFKEMYTYSIKNEITSWISFGLRHLYITIRRYNKNISLVGIDKSMYAKPLATYLHENNFFDCCSIMKVEDFDPGKILQKFIKKSVRKIGNKIRFAFL